jgi:hypothetical protein
MMYPLFETVILDVDIPEDGLKAGDLGTVVELHHLPGMEIGYSVEFFDLLGHTVAVVTLPATNFRRPTAFDRPMARQTRQTDVRHSPETFVVSQTAKVSEGTTDVLQR